MSHPRFSRYVLRTTDVEAATAFYAAVLEHAADGIVALPQAAIARGARPHWLGQIDARQLGGAEALAARFVARGAMRLGPPAAAADFLVLKDPGGAVLAFTDSPVASSAPVVWHQLNTPASDEAAAHYAALLGWSFGDEVHWGALGQHRPFAFGAGEPNAGTLSDLEGRSGVHPHWLFFFAVASLNDAVDRVRSHGGKVIGPIALPNGVRVAACDDAQGAAFGLIEPAGVAQMASG